MRDDPAQPIIAVVDDDPVSLAGLVEALTRRFGADFEIRAHATGAEALAGLARARERGQRTALVIADQWMPGLTGMEVLDRAHLIDPTAQRALLVAWADRTAAETILQGCAFGHLENYLLKPWSPPEVHLYPMVGEFLADWTRAHGPQLELVRVIAEDPSPRGHQIRERLERSERSRVPRSSACSFRAFSRSRRSIVS